ncbi:hypothetical protein V8E53_007492 [Lactarius tabidus]
MIRYFNILDISNCYRLDEKNGWNGKLGWCKLSHICQRWRHLIYGFPFLLGMQIECTNGTPIVDSLNHLPPLPLHIDYRYTATTEDELGIYHALRLHDRVRHIDLHLPSSNLRKVLVLMDQNFPMLEYLSLWSADNKITTLTLPKAFLAPNLRHLTLPTISPPKRLRFLAYTVSLVSLVLNDIQTSSYFRPRLLVARLESLPLLEELSIGFSTPIPRPSTERELLGEKRTPVTIPNLKTLWFKGVSTYLESLVAQIRVPLLEQLEITLFNQIAFELPHLFHLINITEVFKLPVARVYFRRNEVTVTTNHESSQLEWLGRSGPFRLRVVCKQLDWQIECTAQICNALIPTLSGVERLTLDFYDTKIPTELENGAIDGTTWHDLLRSFIGVKVLHIHDGITEELSHALQLDEVELDPGFLPNLRSITAADDLFTSFIDTRRVIGRPVDFLSW